MTPEKAQEIFQLLKKHYPDAKMILNWGNNFELLVAIILSAQCTDKKVNEVSSKLFPKYRKERKEFEEKYKDVIANEVKQSNLREIASSQAPRNDELVEIINFAEIPIEELEQDIKSTGFYHNKAKNVNQAAKV